MKKNIFYLFLIIIIFSLSQHISCKKSGTDPAEKEYVMPDSNVVFLSDTLNDIFGLFTLKCGSRDGCHSPLDQFDLTSYSEIINHELKNGGMMINRWDGASSPLYLILLPDPPMSIGERMPPGGPYLNSNQTNAVKIWIDDRCPER